MSVVVAVRDEDQIWLATDSQVTSGWTKSLLTSQHSFKVFKKPHGVNIGGVGRLRDLNIISTSDIELISENDILKGNINFKNIVRQTVPKLFAELDAFDRLYKDKGMKEMNSAFIVAHGETCFLIDMDGSVIELVDMLATGSGGDISESAYAVLRDTNLTPKEKAIRAVAVSCERDLFVGYPIIITSTKMDSFEVFDGENFFLVNEEGELVLMDYVDDIETYDDDEDIEEEIEEDIEEEKEEYIPEEKECSCEECHCKKDVKKVK